MSVHTFKLTSNCNRYPKKYRHSLVDKMQNKALDIFTTLFEANRINNQTRKCERLEMITKYLKTLELTLNGKTQIYPFKNGVSFLGFHTYVTKEGKVIRKILNAKKRNAQRKYLRFSRLVACGSATEEKLISSFESWQNHVSHGNCYNLSMQMGEKIKRIIGANK